MTKEEIFDQIKRVLEFICDADIKDSTDFADDLGMDSLDLVELMAEVEEKFDIKLNEGHKASTVGELVNNVWEVLHK